MSTCERKQIQLTFSDIDLANKLFGEQNVNLSVTANMLGVNIQCRGNTVYIAGDNTNVELAHNVLKQLYDVLKFNNPVYPVDVKYAVGILSENGSVNLKDIFLEKIYINLKRKTIKPRSSTQRKYIESIKNFDISFGIGPAGTGKTYLAVAMGVSALLENKVSRIVLARPAVEAGEALGFLPGDLYDKINPYLRPLYDAMYDMVPVDKVSSLIDRKIIEIIPIAFMRGRTINDSFIILDEAQNTTNTQMKMFLTRIGCDSKVVVTGDITQIDLPPNEKSGLKIACKALSSVEGISFVFFSKSDVVRHKLVRDVIKAYGDLEGTI